MFRRRYRRVSRFDAELVRRSGHLPPTPADRGFQLLGRAANHRTLWFAIAALLIGKKGATRRAGLRGVAAIGFASLAASGVGKRLFPRRRPAAELLPIYRRMTKRPTSSSFPSGHAASAFAFASAVAMEHRGAAGAVLPLAAAVGYSRVHTGVHWPTDVVAGAAIGVGAAYATRHWWPHQNSLPDGPQRRDTAAELGDGEGLVLVVNPGAGSSGEAGEEVRKAWPRADVIEILPDVDVIAELTKKVENGTDNGEVRAIGAVGGDGTVACVAGVAVEHGLPLVLVPAGTLDHFARDVGIENLDEAQAATRAGSVVVCDAAEVEVASRSGDTERVVYVNTASLGGYPETVRLREKLQTRWSKWAAVLLATTRTLRTAKPMKITLNGHRRLVWMLFVGNGPYEPKGFGAARRPSLASGLLDVRYLRADLPYSRARFLLASLTGTLSTSHVYRHAEVPEVDVVLLDGNRRIALDGEVGPLGSRFSFRVREAALPVYVG
ncbi:MAG: phosphatase PAP2 family protein [Actinophytocola sp.]|uniref:bifunctional phosphatase PAP2/diacylglycerol kinase family protein n=1 Tax=Actinophytocola sp. TaxID=1872138 RepID=UPI003C710D48